MSLDSVYQAFVYAATFWKNLYTTPYSIVQESDPVFLLWNKPYIQIGVRTGPTRKIHEVLRFDCNYPQLLTFDVRNMLDVAQLSANLLAYPVGYVLDKSKPPVTIVDRKIIFPGKLRVLTQLGPRDLGPDMPLCTNNNYLYFVSSRSDFFDPANNPEDYYGGMVSEQYVPEIVNKLLDGFAQENKTPVVPLTFADMIFK